MSNINTRSQRYDQIQRAKKIKRRKKKPSFKKKQEKKQQHYKRTSIDDKIQEALKNLKL